MLQGLLLGRLFFCNTSSSYFFYTHYSDINMSYSTNQSDSIYKRPSFLPSLYHNLLIPASEPHTEITAIFLLDILTPLSLVISIVDLNISLIDNFKQFNSNLEVLSNIKSVKEITFLLHDYHEDDSFIHWITTSIFTLHKVVQTKLDLYYFSILKSSTEIKVTHTMCTLSKY